MRTTSVGLVTAGLCLAAASCGGGEADSVVSTLAARPGAPIEPGLAAGFAVGEHGITARFDAKAAAPSARVVFPKQSNGRVHLEDAATGTMVAFRVRGARSVDAEAHNGYVVYRRAHESGATLLHRALPSGTEDYVAFDARPAAPKLTYDVTIGPNVAGLRLVEGTLEMLDAGGAPRLRVEPPFIVGADGTRVGASLAVEGCAVDNDPAAPWGREVTAPGADSCAVAVTWPDAEVRYPAVLDPRWTTTGSMATARQDHIAILLSNGKVLVAGGRNSGTTTTGLATAELYDRATGTWGATGSMAGARYMHTATQLGTNSNAMTSGKVLVAGGLNAGSTLNTAELYSTAGTFVGATVMNAARQGHTTTLLASGKVLVAGGLNGTTVLNTAAVYDPASGGGTWTATGTMPQAVKFHTATRLLVSANTTLNDKVLVVGGNSGTASVANVQLFDGTSAWSSLTALSSAREGHTATALSNGNVLVTGGKSGSTVLNTTSLFNAATGSGSWASAGTMTIARQAHTATLLPSTLVKNGQVLLAGGSNGTSSLSSAELWNGTSTWTATSTMSTAVQGHTATLLSNNMVLLAGGANGSTTVAKVVLYDASFALSCTSSSQCATGFCVNGVCCDTACNAGCGACNLTGKVGTCSVAAAGTTCRMANGTCDVVEMCNGSSLTCPTDGFKAAGTSCRAVNGACDVAETCSGTSAACPTDRFVAAGTVCRQPAGPCDVAETCSGTSRTCPTDTRAAAGTVCRPALGACDVAETCSGSSASCPADQFAAAGTVCAAANGNQGAETCSGSSSLCPESARAADVLGFETAGDWFAANDASTVLGQNATHTQGTQSTEVSGRSSAAFTSASISSIGSGGTLLLLDLLLPIEIPANPSWSASADMSFSAPSIGISNHSAGHVDLTGLPHGKWETLAFQLPSADAAKLSAGGYSDLTFTIALNLPTNETGHFLFDNLRVVAADVIPSLYGIATNTAGTTKAIFTYTTTATNIQIPYGEGNALLDANNTLIASPTETPPQTFVAATHAPFVATLTGSALTWRIGTHTVTATGGSTRLTTVPAVDGTKDAVLPDGRKVNIDSTPPQDPTATASADPPVGDPDNGFLSGALQVNPSGAAVYTLPIVMAPGVAGMAPNLSLVYNSQGADGIAGQGWELAGLSMIHKCPRTKQQDGVVRPVTMQADPTATSGTNTDGICLDGQRLFEAGSGTYVPEKKDFSTITYFPSDNHFEVKTKAGEIRYYGLTSGARVIGHGLDAQNNTTTATAIWALERVTDVWGNFFYVHYNQDNPDVTQTGFRVTEIDYTGHMNASGVVDTPPFASVRFSYETRPDVRSMRFAQSKFPKNRRLTTITTDRGTYTLIYNLDTTGLISELKTVRYCTGATCLDDLTFGWSNSAATWSSFTGYALPSSIPTGHGLIGTQFIDVDGDGRSDLVYAGPDQNGTTALNLVWLNTASGWTPSTQVGLPFRADLPFPLAGLPGVPTGARFADMDGDGVLDFVVDRANVPCTARLGCPGVWLNRFAQGVGWEFHTEFSNVPATSTFQAMQPINFNSPTFCDVMTNGSCDGFHNITLLPAVLVDINGDGKMDIVRVEEGANGATPALNVGRLEVLLNQGAGSNPVWIRYSEQVFTDQTLDFNSQPGITITDLNRDGFPDLLRERYFSPNSPTDTGPNDLSTLQQVELNERDSGNVQQFSATMNRATGSGVMFSGAQIADLDGDGLHDEVLFAPLHPIIPGSGAVGSGLGVAMNDGAGPRLHTGVGYELELMWLSPNRNATDGNVYPEDFVYALVDINGDGLPDLVRNHYNCFTTTGCSGGVVNEGGGQVLYNTGTTWGTGSDLWHRSAGVNPVPGTITGGCGGAFIDLNGDGIVDFIQEEGNNGTTCNGSKFGRGAWINTASPPIINGFPNGRAGRNTTVSYLHITETAAHTNGVACDGVNASAVYCDDGVVDAGTKRLMVPMRVVSKVSTLDGTGAENAGNMVDTTYAYHSLRYDPDGRGPLGFKRMITYDHASGVKTETSYVQGYPYTGMPTHVVRTQVTQSNAPISDTTTYYCDTTVLAANGIPNCSAPGTKYPAQTSLFVYPIEVRDVTALKHDSSANQLVTDTKFQYDSFGNSKQVVVTTTTGGPSTTSSTISVTTTNQYGTAGSQHEAQGKVTDVQVTATGDVFIGATGHHSSYLYSTVNQFGGASSTALALAKKEIEPGSGWPVQEDTAFYYDQFGNLIITTTCANDFNVCSPNGTSPSPVDVEHPPFRTTTVSFDPGSFNAPAGPGLISSLDYRHPGRFPVQARTNAIQPGGVGGGAAHVEYQAYDPIKGVLLQKTGPNGIHTCYTYDDLGRPTSEIGRCGSSSPIVSTMAYFKPAMVFNGEVGTLAPGTPPFTKLITAARSASGATSWAFTDHDGKPIETLARSFGGGFIETLTTYTGLGKVMAVTKPFLIQNFTDTPATTYKTTTFYDVFNRVGEVTDDLGAVGGSNQLVTITTYDGLSVTTTRTVSGSPQTRTETKNVLGKLQSVVDSLGGEIDYTYDPDGNLIAASSAGQNLVVTFYDPRGRKTKMTDADLGVWNYTFDGFGDLVSQTDANNQQFAMTYDQLGRMLTRQNLTTAATAQWIYDTAGSAGIGKLAAMVSEPDPNFAGPCGLPSGATVSGGNRAVKTYAYTGFGDLQAVAECADGSAFQTSYEYDNIGRQSLIRYPAVNGQQLAVGYHYTDLGHLQYLSDESSDYGVLWQAKAMNAFGQVTDEQARNGVETVRNRSPGNGWLLETTSTAHSDGNTVIQDWAYSFDEVGNLAVRNRFDQVADAASSESFYYDALNRVIQASMNVGSPVSVKSTSEYVYSGNGNLTQKDGKTYTYDGSCVAIGRSGSGLHQVCSIDGGPKFVYDAAGNLTANGDRTITYNAHNKATQITSAAGSAKFMYGADDNRVAQVTTSGATTSRTVYVGLGGTGKSMYERTTTGTTVQHTNFIYAGGAHGGNAFALRLVAGSNTTTRYLSFDHLGSTTAVSDEKGHIATATGADTEVLGYDPWGARRNPDGQPASPSSTFPSSAGHRDFTGQETIPNVGLINMNGRVYDPVLARFLSPDPRIQAPDNLQNYNRYSYVLNNPLRYTDPTGYDFWDSVGHYFSNPINDIELGLTLAVCGLGTPAACMVMGATLSLMNAGMAVAQGASFGQTALNAGIGFGIGMLTSGIVSAALPADASPIWGLIAGSASAAVTTAITDVAMGRSLGWDVVQSAAISAVQGAATLALQQVAALSQAPPGGGSGAARVERVETVDSVLADIGVTGGEISSEEALLAADTADLFRETGTNPYAGSNGNPLVLAEDEGGFARGLHLKVGVGGAAAGVFGLGHFSGLGLNLSLDPELFFTYSYDVYVGGGGAQVQFGEIGTGTLVEGTRAEWQIAGTAKVGVGVDVTTSLSNGPPTAEVGVALGAGDAGGVRYHVETNVRATSAVGNWFYRFGNYLMNGMRDQ